MSQPQQRKALLYYCIDYQHDKCRGETENFVCVCDCHIGEIEVE